MKNPYFFVFALALLGFVLMPTISAQCVGGSPNGICDPNSTENPCTCPQDCLSCESFSDEFFDYVCIENQCHKQPKTGVCGNGICETEYNEDFGSCPADCEPTQLEFEIVSPDLNQSFARGQQGQWDIRITSSGREIRGAYARVRGPFQTIELKNSGFDNHYTGKFQIRTNETEGSHEITVEATFRELSAKETFGMNIKAELKSNVLVPSEGLLGDLIPISGNITNGSTPTVLPFDLRITDEQNQELWTTTIQTDANGAFETEFKTSLNDSPGKWRVNASGMDDNNNRLSFERTIEMFHPSQQRNLNVVLLGDTNIEVARGEKVTVLVNVLENNQLATDANLELIDPLNKKVLFPSAPDGNFSLLYTIPNQLPLGPNTFILRATRSGVISVQGQTEVTINIVANEFTIELVSPQTRFFSIGDNVQFRVLMKYLSGPPVLDANAHLFFNEIKIPLQAEGGGYYTARYTVQEQDAGELFLKIEATDQYNQTSALEHKLDVFGFGIGYYFSNYGTLILAGIALIIAVAWSANMFWRNTKGKTRLQKRKFELVELEKDLQTKYFEKGAMTKTEFETQLQEYEDERKKIQKKLKPKKGK